MKTAVDSQPPASPVTPPYDRNDQIDGTRPVVGRTFNLGEIKAVIENTFDFLDDRLAAEHTDAERRKLIDTHASLHLLRNLPSAPKFDQPAGTVVGGFKVGNLATMTRSSAVGVIVGAREEEGKRRVTVEFGIPQPVDAPDGAVANRFDLTHTNITSTFTYDVRRALQSAHDLINDRWASSSDIAGQQAQRVVNDLRTVMDYLNHGLDAVGGQLPKRAAPQYEIRRMGGDGIDSAYHRISHARDALDLIEEQIAAPLTHYLINTSTGERYVSFAAVNVLNKQASTPGQFFEARDQVDAPTLSDEQRAAVVAFRDANGRDWKDKLGALWMNGNYSRRGINLDQAALLQQVRNQFGPEWLENVAAADLNSPQRLERDDSSLCM